MPIPTLVRPNGSWTFDSEVPLEWPELVRRHHAGFFHTPLGLRAGAPAGEPIYGRYFQDDRILGIAAGIRTHCRLSGHFRHLYFPCWPAFAEEGDRKHAMLKLSTALRSDGVAEVRWDSFDAACTVAPSTRPNRWEYVVPLDEIAEQEAWPPSTHHRRFIRRGQKSGWTLRELTGPDAKATLTRVLESAARRAKLRGVRIEGSIPPAAFEGLATGPCASAVTYAAMAGDELLAAILVGRCESRAYYLMGAATEAGYEVGASTWLQAEVISRLADAGLGQYNLGGAPLHATDEGDPDHGLHRFKIGFGARVVGCSGERWILLAAHLRSHQLFGWAAGLVS